MKSEQRNDPDEEATPCARYHDHTPEVLIVDDDPRVADVLQQLLEDEGFVVAHEADGRSALVHIERRQPDVVLADMKMPRLGGVGLLREIRIRWEGIDVILMSASETPIGLSVPFLRKPFDLDDVLSAICNHPGHA